MSKSQVRAHPRVSGWGMYGTLGLVASTVIHASTFTGHTLRPSAPVRLALLCGIFPLLGALLVQSRPWQPERTLRTGVRYRWLDWQEWRPFLPAWAPPLVTALGIYWLATFAFCAFYLPSGGVGAAPTNAQVMYMVRGYSSTLMVFYVLPALFFTYAPPDGAAANAPGKAEQAG